MRARQAADLLEGVRGQSNMRAQQAAVAMQRSAAVNYASTAGGGQLATSAVAVVYVNTVGYVRDARSVADGCIDVRRMVAVECGRAAAADTMQGVWVVVQYVSIAAVDRLQGVWRHSSTECASSLGEFAKTARTVVFVSKTGGGQDARSAEAVKYASTADGVQNARSAGATRNMAHLPQLKCEETPLD